MRRQTSTVACTIFAAMHCDSPAYCMCSNTRMPCLYTFVLRPGSAPPDHPCPEGIRGACIVLVRTQLYDSTYPFLYCTVSIHSSELVRSSVLNQFGIPTVCRCALSGTQEGNRWSWRWSQRDAFMGSPRHRLPPPASGRATCRPALLQRPLKPPDRGYRDLTRWARIRTYVCTKSLAAL